MVFRLKTYKDPSIPKYLAIKVIHDTCGHSKKVVNLKVDQLYKQDSVFLYSGDLYDVLRMATQLKVNGMAYTIVLV